MRACVLGAAGTIGPAIARDLAISGEVDELLLLDLDGPRAEALAAAIESRDVRGAPVDASDPEALASALEGTDLVVNSASYRLNLEVMEACLRAGAHYLDLGGLYHVTAKQLETFSPRDGLDRFEAAGLLAVLGIGSSPGKTNLMAVQAARELGGAVDAIHVSAAGRDMSPPAGFSVPYALQTLIDELTLAPVVIRDGRPAEIQPLSDGGVIDFGDPIGPGGTIHTLHSEMLTFGDSFGCREGSFRLSLHADLVERLRQLTEASPEEIEAAARDAVPPSGDTVSVHLIEASSGGRRVTVRAVTRPVEELGVGGGVASTAAPAAAAVRLLARGSLMTRGVHPPERCIDPEEMFAELRLRGCEFDVEVATDHTGRDTPGREAEEVAR